jgi:hypothetical protein
MEVFRHETGSTTVARVLTSCWNRWTAPVSAVYLTRVEHGLANVGEQVAHDRYQRGEHADRQHQLDVLDHSANATNVCVATGSASANGSETIPATRSRPLGQDGDDQGPS